MCWRPFRRTSFNSILTLVHPLVLQLREYPLKPVSFTLCHFYLRSISPLLFSSQLSSISAACFPVSIHCPADVRLCGVVEQAKDKHGLSQSNYDTVRVPPVRLKESVGPGKSKLFHSRIFTHNIILVFL